MTHPFKIAHLPRNEIRLSFPDGSIFDYMPTHAYPHKYRGPLRSDCYVNYASTYTPVGDKISINEMLNLLRDTVANAGLELVRQKLTEG